MSLGFGLAVVDDGCECPSVGGHDCGVKYEFDVLVFVGRNLCLFGLYIELELLNRVGGLLTDAELHIAGDLVCVLYFDSLDLALFRRH